jgi:hypothetical protein
MLGAIMGVLDTPRAYYLLVGHCLPLDRAPLTDTCRTPR